MEMSLNVSPLKQEFSIGKLTLRNRTVMAPMTRLKAPGHVVDENTRDHYLQRAKGGIGLIVTEGLAINGSGHGFDGVPALYGEYSESWRSLVNEIQQAGAKIIAQLWHVGSQRMPSTGPDQQAPIYGPSAVVYSEGATLPSVMGDTDIDDVISDYVQAALTAKDVGFDGIEIHAAHGYLIDQFFWDKTNTRTDKFGGESIKERTTFAAKLICQVREAVGPDFPIFFRLSQWKVGYYEAKTVQNETELSDLLLPLVNAGVDVFHASARRWWQSEFEGSELSYAGWIKKITQKPVVAVGSVGVDNPFQALEVEQANSSSEEEQVKGFNLLAEHLSMGEFDLVAVGRAALADCEFANKLLNNRVNEINPFAGDTHIPYKN
ncbi:hypothetical protein [Piscirickettsia salmonis]|uniref:oxidoreductase n=3 Tax=Piscirickettsia salmonis TaxID=1238 RepID=UPI0006C76F5E|nr:hypothetical protein [Piscirickettsia salmonis]APS45833.1 hypothetical protein AVI48_15480 [Piscirickettsia salmonis]APS49284.1 hypothetical protein AVI49_16645 [Piscirickettsia salmonis]